jgi:hypothetical protein
MKVDMERFQAHRVSSRIVKGLVREFLGKPFVVSKGPDRYNCWSFLKEFMSRAGYTFDMDFSHFDRKKGGLGVPKDWYRVDKPQRMDIVWIRFCERNHCGVMISDHSYVHCTESVGVCKSDVGPGVVGFYRLKDVCIR